MAASQPFTDEELARLRERLGRGRWARRNLALLEVLCRTGFRSSEALWFTVERVEVEGEVVAYLSVPARMMKRKRRGRTVPLHAEARGALRVWLDEMERLGWKHPKAAVFRSERRDAAIDRRSLWRIIHRAAQAEGITKPVGGHSGRKLYTKRLQVRLGNNLPALQKALGHADRRSTLAYLDGLQDDAIERAILE